MRYEAHITEQEYQDLRQASMRGKLEADFEMINSTVRFTTRNPKRLCEELQRIIDAGETSWYEIFDVNIFE